MGARAPLPGSSCTYSHLAPHLNSFLSDNLDSDPLHEPTHSSGEISLSALLLKLVFSQTLFFLNLLQTAKSNLSLSSKKKNPFGQSQVTLYLNLEASICHTLLVL